MRFARLFLTTIGEPHSPKNLLFLHLIARNVVCLQDHLICNDRGRKVEALRRMMRIFGVNPDCSDAEAAYPSLIAIGVDELTLLMGLDKPGSSRAIPLQVMVWPLKLCGAKGCRALAIYLGADSSAPLCPNHYLGRPTGPDSGPIRDGDFWG